MNQNKHECIKYMDKIKKQLDSFGFDSIITSNKENILCKVPGDFKATNNSTAIVKTTGVGLTTTCPHTASSACPYTACRYPNATCHHHNHNIGNVGNNNNGNNSNNDNDGALEAIGVCSCSLFRIMPTDIHNGLFLHVIKLHGETCELKMTFECSDDGATELVNVLKFLVE